MGLFRFWYSLSIVLLLVYFSLSDVRFHDSCVLSFDKKNVESQILMYSDGLSEIRLENVKDGLRERGCIRSASMSVCYSTRSGVSGRKCSYFSDLDLSSGYLSKESLERIATSMKSSSSMNYGNSSIQYLRKGDL